MALDHIDEVISIIRSSQTDSEASSRLIERFGFTPEQTTAILEMKLRRLTVAGVGDGHDHILVGDEVLDIQVLLNLADLGAALVAKLLGDLAHLFLDDAQDLLLVRQQVLVVGDGAAQAVQLFLDLVALQAGQAAQLHLAQQPV